MRGAVGPINNVRVLNKADLKYQKVNHEKLSDYEQKEDMEEENLDARQSLILDEGKTFYKASLYERQHAEQSNKSGPFSIASSNNHGIQASAKNVDLMSMNENYMTNQTDLATITHGSSHVIQNTGGAQSIVSPCRPT